MIKNRGTKKSHQTRVNKKELFLLITGIVIYFFYMRSKDNIVNYPSWLSYSIFSLVIILTWIVQKKQLFDQLRKAKENSAIYPLVLQLINTAILSWFITGILLIPFNYINIYVSKRNDIEYVNCKLRKVSTYSKNRTIFYEWNGRINVKYAYKPIMEEIKTSGNYEDYLFFAGLRKGLLGSYFLEDWDIKRR